MSQYSWLIVGWIWQDSEKTKINSGDFVGSAIITGYFEGGKEEGQLAGRSGR